MNVEPETHIVRFSNGGVKVEVIERTTFVLFCFHFDKAPHERPPEWEAIRSWLNPIIRKYTTLEKPAILINGNTGEVVTIIP